MASAGKGTLFGRIDADNVDGTIRRLARACYVVAALQAVAQILLLGLAKGQAENLADAVIYAGGGYFLAARKSRAVAVTLLAYAVAAGAFALAALGGTAEGGAGIFMALIMIAIGWRGVRATWLYHRINGLKTVWKHVVAASGAVVVAIILVFVVLVVLEIWAPHYLDDDALAGAIIMAAIVLSVVGVMWPLTRRYPFTYPEMLGGRNSADIPAVFD